MGAVPELAGARLALFGTPYDGTCSFRPGTRFGPAATRNVSEGIETYCPVCNADLEDVHFADIGDLVLPTADKAAVLLAIEQAADELYSIGVIPAALGGEHLVSLPLLKAAFKHNPDLVLVQFDAHLDLRESFMGSELSHATVMRQISKFVEPSRILQVGPRSGTREEFETAQKFGTYRPDSLTPKELREWVGHRPLYVTVDLDILDPSIFPGTGTPEPGGVSYRELQAWIVSLAGCNWIGWDAVELSPEYDSTQVSSIVSSKIVRTLVLSSLAKPC
ncbi:MAG: agmatinase [Calditrichaeota bacterium]|nr:agmatinase [Calditrichota bacterium]MCB9391575.1 agmatinase [Calditrichota bacterium]